MLLRADFLFICLPSCPITDAPLTPVSPWLVLFFSPFLALEDKYVRMHACVWVRFNASASQRSLGWRLLPSEKWISAKWVNLWWTIAASTFPQTRLWESESSGEDAPRTVSTGLWGSFARAQSECEALYLKTCLSLFVCLHSAWGNHWPF